MFAKGSVAVNTEDAWKPVPNAPVEESNGNAVIPFWVAAYRNPGAGVVVEVPFPEPPHPESTDTRRIVRDVLTAAQKQFALMSKHPT
jgi:hypothetical protein